MKLPRNDLIALAGGLKALDGRTVVEKDGNGKAHVITKPYDLSGKVRYAIARMQRAAKPVLEDISDLQRAILGEHLKDADEISGAPARAYQAALDQAMREEVDFTEHRLAAADLKVETNQLDPSTIAALLPILDGEI